MGTQNALDEVTLKFPNQTSSKVHTHIQVLTPGPGVPLRWEPDCDCPLYSDCDPWPLEWLFDDVDNAFDAAAAAAAAA